MEEERISSKKRNVGLDIVRIVSAFMVALFHLMINNGFSTKIIWLDNIIVTGANFMVLFIMLSGYSIHLTYHDYPFENIDMLMKFYKRRFLRIYPAYWLFLLTIFLFRCSVPETKIGTLILIPIDILGLQSWFPKAFGYLGNDGTWFITVIFSLYILYPLIRLMVFRCYRRRKGLALILLCWFLASWVGIVRVFLGGDFSAYYALPTFRAFEFILGILAAQWMLDAGKDRKPLGGRKLAVAFLLLAAIYIGSILFLFHKEILGVRVWERNWLSYNFVIIPIYAVVILLCGQCTGERLPNFLKRLIGYMSRLTFPFYLTQTFANRLLRYQINNNRIKPDDQVSIFAFGIVSNVIFAVILYYTSEIFTKMIKNYRKIDT